jgi:phenylalanyl-tRNA synthetase alpha chain
MKEKLTQIKRDLTQKLEAVTNLKELDDVRVEFLGKKGELTSILKGMGRLSEAERPLVGQVANEVREFIEVSLGERKKTLSRAEIDRRIKEETIDVTMPGKAAALGRKHPMTLVIDEVVGIFMGMGYNVAEGPEVENDYYNFDALNIPATHPARSVQDTFYVEGGFSLRTATSPVQVRVMEKRSRRLGSSAPERFSAVTTSTRRIRRYSTRWRALSSIKV